MKRMESEQVQLHPVVRLQLRIRSLMMMAGLFEVFYGVYHACCVFYGE